MHIGPFITFSKNLGIPPRNKWRLTVLNGNSQSTVIWGATGEKLCQISNLFVLDQHEIWTQLTNKCFFFKLSLPLTNETRSKENKWLALVKQLSREVNRRQTIQRNYWKKNTETTSTILVSILPRSRVSDDIFHVDKYTAQRAVMCLNIWVVLFTMVKYLPK